MDLCPTHIMSCMFTYVLASLPCWYHMWVCDLCEVSRHIHVLKVFKGRIPRLPGRGLRLLCEAVSGLSLSTVRLGNTTDLI